MAERTCLGCGVALILHPRERNPRKWCSPGCGMKAKRRNPEWAQRQRDLASTRGRLRTAERQMHATPIAFVECVVCARTFVVNRAKGGRPRQVCSNRCRNKRNRLQELPDSRARRLEAKKAKAPEYQRRYRMNSPVAQAASRARCKWRRALTSGAAVVEKFDSHEIFDRDGWRCHLCGKQVGKSYKFPHPRSASLDHIIPLTRGGQHSRVNSACAHLGCNMEKSNRLANDQLRLIG